MPGPVTPIYAIPTTAGTGSEVTGLSVITDRANKVKMVLRGVPYLIPKCVFLDPELLAFIPPRVAAETGGDALTHAVEMLRFAEQHCHYGRTGPFGDHADRQIPSQAGGKSGGYGSGGEHAAWKLPGRIRFFQRGSRTCPFPCPSGGGSLSFEPWCLLFTLPSGCDGIQPPHLPGEVCLPSQQRWGRIFRGMTARRAAKEAVKAVRELFADVGIPMTFFGPRSQFQVESEDGCGGLGRGSDAGESAQTERGTDHELI